MKRCDKCGKPAVWEAPPGLTVRMNLCGNCKVEMVAYAQLVIDTLTADLTAIDCEMVERIVKANRRGKAAGA